MGKRKLDDGVLVDVGFVQGDGVGKGPVNLHGVNLFVSPVWEGGSVLDREGSAACCPRKESIRDMGHALFDEFVGENINEAQGFHLIARGGSGDKCLVRWFSITTPKRRRSRTAF